jgi:tetratricopeptide (TPR) repeat protein
MASSPTYCLTKEISETRIRENHTVGGARGFPMSFGTRLLLVAAWALVVSLSLPALIVQAGPREEIAALSAQGTQYLARSDNAKAADAFERAFRLAEKALRPDDPALGAVINNLGVVYLHQNRYAEAQSLLGRALPIQQKALGGDHPQVAQIYHDLGGLFLRRGEPEALAFYTQALKIREKALGPDHADVAATLYGLALLIAKTITIPRLNHC